MTIDDATPDDVPAIARIYNDVIATSTAVFTETPVTEQDRREWLADRLAAGMPVRVARWPGGEVIAFGSYGQFRPWSGYRTSVEHSVHVAASSRRQGVGRAIVTDLISIARASGMHAMVAGIDAGNDASIALHAQLGFTEVGLLPQIASKFGRWVDLRMLELLL